MRNHVLKKGVSRRYNGRVLTASALGKAKALNTQSTSVAQEKRATKTSAAGSKMSAEDVLNLVLESLDDSKAEETISKQM